MCVDIYVCVDKISFFRKMWCNKSKEYFTRMFLTEDRHYFDIWEGEHGHTFEDVREKIVELSSD